jgi:hypothetical protein
MLNLSRDINSLSNFKRKTPEFMEQLKETRSPLVLTVNGVAELVVQSAESYQKPWPGCVRGWRNWPRGKPFPLFQRSKICDRGYGKRTDEISS